MITESPWPELDGRGHLDCGPSKQRFLVAARDLLDERGLELCLAQRLNEILQLMTSAEGSHATDECPSNLLADLRASLPARLAARTASLSEVGASLAISPRTLQRRLAEAGTSWRAEVDTARRELAAQLAGAGHGRKAIARRVGYSDTRGLRRALRRWNGEQQACTRCQARSGEQGDSCTR